MTREEALTLWLPVIKTGVESMQECNEALDMAIKALEQEPKTGHWIYSKAVNTSEIIWSECSECKDGERGCAKRMKYCPNCGAKMAESEDKE